MTASYGNIIAWAGGAGEHDGAVQCALELARRFGARLTGVAACLPAPVVADPLGAEFDVGELYRLYRETAERSLARRRDDFLAQVETSAGSADWREAIEDPSDALVRLALISDLIVLPTAPREGRLDAASVVLRAGRPVILVPEGAAVTALGRIVIAWRDGREARLSVASALPLLQGAETVTLLRVAQGAAARGLEKQLADVRSWLIGHGVNPWIEVVEARERSLGHTLLAEAERLGADLIVAGAYGHSRLAEWVVGGVTRTLMAGSRVPLLLAH